MYVYMPKNDAEHMQQQAVHNRPAEYPYRPPSYRQLGPSQVKNIILWKNINPLPYFYSFFTFYFLKMNGKKGRGCICFI